MIKISKARRLAVVATHPIQYWVPIYRHLAAKGELKVTAFFLSDHSVRGGRDKEFDHNVAWDVPLLEGYDHRFLENYGSDSRSGSFLSYRCKDFISALKSDRFDALLIPGYSPIFYLQSISAARTLNIPVIMRGEITDDALPRGVFKRTLRTIALKWLYQRMGAFGAVGSPARRHLRRLGVPDECVHWSPYCVDDELFEREYRKLLPNRSEVLRRLGIGSNEVAFVFSGKLVPKKDPMTLAKALTLLNSISHLHLIVLGTGELSREFERTVRPILGERLHCMGFVNQTGLGEYYSAGNCLVLPSAWGETWGLAVNEAMQFGMPAIVSDRVGCREDLVQTRKTGWVFPAGDAAALAACLEDAATDAGRLRQMGETARLLVGGFTVAEASKGLLAAIRYACR